MKAPEKNRHLQLNLRLADPPPTAMAGEKNEELLLAIIDLLLDAVATEGGVDPVPDRRTEDAR
jgi:hypothetical protein